MKNRKYCFKYNKDLSLIDIGKAQEGMKNTNRKGYSALREKTKRHTAFIFWRAFDLTVC